ncbi:MAG: polysaccharide deacetylase family protein [Treponema sp.]|nr:polysaccharide deacetylase family protein [Treponema sp.]
MKKIIFSLGFFLCLSSISAKISFGPADINDANEVLYTVNQDIIGFQSIQSLYRTTIVNGKSKDKPQLLTCYPERMELLDGKTILQIRNRFGTAQYNSRTETFSYLETAPSIPEKSLPVNPYEASPDGNFVCYIQRETISSGLLILKDVQSGKQFVLCDDARQSYDSVPVKWSPDSSILIYEKNDVLYFCNPKAVLTKVEMDEKYRKIGKGTINSINWATQKTLIYIDDYLVYKINSKELYTIGLYSGIIGQGKPIGRLPYRFNHLTDKFSVDPAVSSIFLIQDKSLFSYLKFRSSASCDFMDVIYSRPFIDSGSSLIDSFVFWDNNNKPVLWVETLPYYGAKEKAAVYKISAGAVKVLEIADSGRPVSSPDGKKIAYAAGSSIYVYDVNTWQRLAELSGEKIISFVWINNNSLYTGSEATIKKWNLLSNTTDLFMITSVKGAYWNKADNSILAKTQGNYFYRYLSEKGIWVKTREVEVMNSMENGRYRLFTGTTQNQKYENALYIRTLSRKAVTKPMCRESIVKTPLPKKAALVFDAYDNADGLTDILYVLQKYRIKATFFLNGEFIRRYPMETRQIQLSGYETGSMFFSTTDLVNNPFIVDEDFIVRGLARNEDEFYQCTSKELSLYWHAPYYSVNSKIINHAKKAGYEYVNTLFVNTDTPLLDKDTKPQTLIYEYCDLLKRVDSGIIPVTVGYSQGNRTEPLYKYLDILICALVDSGFEFVTVSEL